MKAAEEAATVKAAERAATTIVYNEGSKLKEAAIVTVEATEEAATVKAADGTATVKAAEEVVAADAEMAGEAG